MIFHMPRIASLPSEERERAIDEVTAEAHAEISELIAAQAINDAIEADSTAHALRNRR